MPRYAVEYEGYLYVDVDTEYDASANGSDILSAALPYGFHDGNWMIVNVELDNDNVPD